MSKRLNRDHYTINKAAKNFFISTYKARKRDLKYQRHTITDRYHKHFNVKRSCSVVAKMALANQCKNV